MVSSRPRLEAWPLLPRPTADARPRPEDEPAEAVITALAGIAALILLLRWGLPGSGLAREVTLLIALWGGLGSFLLTAVIMALLVGAAVATPLLPLFGPVKEAGLAAFDHAVHLAFVLTAAGLLGTIVLHGRVPGIAVWFAAQAVALWGFHRTRLWLSRRSAA